MTSKGASRLKELTPLSLCKTPQLVGHQFKELKQTVKVQQRSSVAII